VKSTNTHETDTYSKEDVTTQALTNAKQLLAAGQIDKAIAKVSSVFENYPDHVEGLYILAVCYRYSSRFSDSVATLKRLISTRPQYARAYQELGHIRLQSNERGEAGKSYERAVQLNPALLASWNRLQSLYQQTGKADLAAQAAKQIAYLSVLPKELLTATSLFHEGAFPKAESLCRAFMRQNPQHLEGMRLLANIGIKMHVLRDAEYLLETCLAAKPDFVAARYDYVHVLHKRQKYEAAFEQAKKMVQEEPGNPKFLLAFATANMSLAHFDAALDIYDQLLADDPENADLHLLRGHLMRAVGKQSEAVSSYRSACQFRPSAGGAYWSLANLKTYKFEDEEIAQMQTSEAQAATPLSDRYHLCFSLGQAFEEKGNFEKAFDYFKRGNALKKGELNFNIDKVLSEFASQKQVCTAEFFKQRREFGHQASDPIFIVGLPRAGSTLLEQILASHPQIEGTLELPNVMALAAQLAGRQKVGAPAHYPGILSELTAEQVREFGENYIASTHVHRTDRPFFTDKMPNNFVHIGLISLMLPNAKIIDARRDPVACCFSGFKQLFAEGQQFSYDLSDIGKYYKGYTDLMEYWDQVLPDKILRVQYEDVIDDIELQVKRILDFCGLPFDSRCVDFHKTKRTVRTASSEQVRQPLFKTGLDYWKNFDPYLGDLKDALTATD